MRELQQMLENSAVRRLAWALVAFLWQGTLVAAILACLGVVLRRRDPRARYAAGCAALLLMLVLPAATYVRHTEGAAPPLPGAGWAAARDVTRGFAPMQIAARRHAGSGGFVPALRKSAAVLAPWLVPVWFCGALFLSLRFLAGWNAARRLPLHGLPATPAVLEALARLQRRLRVSRPVLLLESAAVSVPTALGTLRPAILMPVCAVTGLWPEALEAVLAHELAHIRRHDYFVNLLQTAAETLLFYHPAVWWVSRRIRVERENCCDDLAVAATGNARGYVRALLVLEEIRSLPKATSILAVASDGGSLWRRIVRLLPSSSRCAEETPSWLAGLLGLAMLATIGAAARVSGFAQSPEDRAVFTANPRVSTSDAARVVRPASEISATPTDSSAAPQPGEQRKEASPPTPSRGAAVAGGVAGGIHGGIAAAIERGVQGGIAGGVSGGIPGGVEGGVEDEDRAPDEKKAKLSPEDLANLRRHGVTPEFLGGLSALGYKMATVDDLLSLRIHGVTAEYISGLMSLLGKLSLNELVSLKIHGVTPEFVKHFRDAGYTTISADDAISLRIHGVEASTASEWAKLSARKPGLDEIVSARIHGVTPEFIREIRSLGYPSPSLDELTAIRIHGVTPEFIREIQSLGYPSPSLDELTAIRIHGVTPDFIRRVNGSAGTRLSLDELVDRRIHRRQE
jgi:beta-lactamase regulating signal transducer with metallopeptidase domain